MSTVSKRGAQPNRESDILAGKPRFPSKGSFKGDIGRDIDVEVDVDVDF